MRVLLVAPPWFTVPPQGYGGIEWIVALLADGLVDAGHEVTLVASGGSKTKADLLTVFDEPPTDRIGDATPEIIHALAAYNHRLDFDVVHDHCGFTGPALGSVASGPPVVHTLHGPWTDSNRDFYRRAAPPLRLVAISEDQATRAPEGVPIAGVVPNAIPIGLYPFRAEKEDFLLYVGRANREKGPEVAVEAARQLGQRLVMVIKVNEPAEREYFDAEIRPRMDGADVEVRTGVDNETKAELMGRAACVVFPAQWPEPFGLVPAEANACGTPVVAYAEGAIPEVVVDGRTGYVVPRGDLDALCNAIENAERIDPEECRQEVERRFSPQRMVEGYLDIYKHALDAASQSAK